jgi:hypothetical protein
MRIMAYFKSKVKFDAVPMTVGSGWYVLVTPPKEKQSQLGGFKTEDEAKAWIAQKSSKWLKEYENGKYA